MLAAAIPDAREHARGPGRRPAASELLPATQLLPIARVEVLLPWKPRPQRPPARSSLERSSHSCPPRLCSSAAIDAIILAAGRRSYKQDFLSRENPPILDPGPRTEKGFR